MKPLVQLLADPSSYCRSVCHNFLKTSSFRGTCFIFDRCWLGWAWLAWLMLFESFDLVLEHLIWTPPPPLQHFCHLNKFLISLRLHRRKECLCTPLFVCLDSFKSKLPAYRLGLIPKFCLCLAFYFFLRQKRWTRKAYLPFYYLHLNYKKK